MSANTTINQAQGHWLLAKMGKKVLRPGGIELTQKMLKNLNITGSDKVVEFAPGLGLTAKMTLEKNPESYTGVELNQEAGDIARKHLQKNHLQAKHLKANHLQEKSGSNKHNFKIVIGNASATTLADESYTKVYGEAMLTMQSDRKKADIISEAYRILQTGGLYGIHELGLQPEDITDELKSEIQRALSRVIKVNARPLTIKEWSALGEAQGFKVKTTASNAMALLQPKRLLADEGFFGVLRIGFNVLTHPKERSRILAMRNVFKQYHQHLNAVSVVFEK